MASKRNHECTPPMMTPEIMGTLSVFHWQCTCGATWAFSSGWRKPSAGGFIFQGKWRKV